MKNILLTLAALLLCSAAKADDRSDWMKDLPDDTPVCLVSIPGAHDACTGEGFTGRVCVEGTYYSKYLVEAFAGDVGANYATTQDKTMQEQWDLGIRAFDLRPCVVSGSLNINHGIVETNLSFKDAMTTITDNLKSHPKEFAVIHLLHETDGDVSNASTTTYESLLNSELSAFSSYLVPWRRDLTVGDMRGKVVILYRDSYSTAPTGGVMSGWAGYVDWSAQTKGKVTGSDQSKGVVANGALYMQDFSDTHESGAVDTKVSALETMLEYTTTHTAYNRRRNVWVFNFASAYSKVGSIEISLGFISKSIATIDGVSLSEGYRDNASHTNKAIIDYLGKHQGPTGIILADYVGVDTSEGYSTMGASLVEAIIENNFKYLPLEAITLDGEDITTQLGCYDAWDGTTGWTVSNVVANAGGQHWSGDPSDAYFEQVNSHWSTASKWEDTMTKTLSNMPNGLYRLTAAGRSSSGALCTISLNDDSYSFPAQGDTGGTMDIDGKEWESMSEGKAAGATFANNGTGRGWAWGSVETTVTDGTLTVKGTFANTSGSQYQWASLDDLTLLYIGVSKDELTEAIAQASAVTLPTANLGDDVFQLSPGVVADLSEALATANEVNANANADQETINSAATALASALEAYQQASLNEPSEGQLFSLTLADEASSHNGNPASFHTSDTAQGGYELDFLSPYDPNWGQAFTLTPVSSLTDGYTISFTDIDGATRYLSLASDQSVSTTTSQGSAHVFKVTITDTEGVWHILNTSTSSPLACSADGTLCTLSEDSDSPELTFATAETVTVPITLTGSYGTLTLPFASALPSGLTAYTCAELQDDGQTLSLAEAQSLEANTPYIIEGEGSFSPLTGTGTYHSSYSLTAGLLTGTLTEASAPTGAYTLTAQSDGTEAFSPAQAGAVTLSAYTACISLPDTENTPNVILITSSADDEEVTEDDEEVTEDDDSDEEGNEEGTAGDDEDEDEEDADAITAPTADQAPAGDVYDLQGRKVSRPTRGLYIIGGHKVLAR